MLVNMPSIGFFSNSPDLRQGVTLSLYHGSKSQYQLLISRFKGTHQSWYLKSTLDDTHNMLVKEFKISKRNRKITIIRWTQQIHIFDIIYIVIKERN